MQTITVDYNLSKSPDAVWRALTQPDLLAKWLMPNDIRPEVGAHFTLQARPLPGWDGVVRCEVLAVEPNRKLSYSWKGGSEQIGFLDTVVTWTLTPVEGGTLLHLEHAGFGPANAFAFQSMGDGWRGNIADRLKALFTEA